ncbi:MAG: hypothetical protein JSV30_05240 [Candidatus Omnitrophota bacterium]|nr:MAG: hypothetical protein JSV30_05240 [Candidatus Omnitrophota bacterium]
MVEFSKDEQKALEEIISRLSKRAKQKFTLDSLLGKWSAFIADVEKGYSGTVYDYTNDLSVRDLLEELIIEAPPNAGAKLMAAIQKLDQKFIKLTQEAAFPFGSWQEGKAPFWWKRIPLKLRGELKEDLEQ